MGLLRRLREGVGAALAPAHDPRPDDQRLYAREIALLQQVRDALGGVAAARLRLTSQVERLAAQRSTLLEDATAALQVGGEAAARSLLRLRHAAGLEQERLQVPLAEVAAEERALRLAEDRLLAGILAARSWREAGAARFAAAQAQLRAGEALAGWDFAGQNPPPADDLEAETLELRARALAYAELSGREGQRDQRLDGSEPAAAAVVAACEAEVAAVLSELKARLG